MNPTMTCPTGPATGSPATTTRAKTTLTRPAEPAELCAS